MTNNIHTSKELDERKHIQFFTSLKLSMKHQINKDIALQQITRTKEKIMS